MFRQINDDARRHGHNEVAEAGRLCSLWAIDERRGGLKGAKLFFDAQRTEAYRAMVRANNAHFRSCLFCRLYGRDFCTAATCA